jgi:acyl-CoA reductase-like NAD-dependent aldehyde dehydrogenase
MAYITSANRMLIGGELVNAKSSDFHESLNPANEEVIGLTPAADQRDVDMAVEAAERAWPIWWEKAPVERARAMRNFAQRIAERGEEILRVEVADTGNTIVPTRNDITVTVNALNYFAGLAYELKGATVPGAGNALHLSTHEPYGIVARITPFNHPLMFSVARTAAALVSGNAVIVKPPETSPLSAMILAEIAQKTLPAGIFNIVTGTGPQVGDAIVRHPKIKRIAFIGSANTGRAIQRAAAEAGVKHVSLELGGKNPLIAFADADPSKVADLAVRGMNFGWQGQSCGSTSRLLLHADIFDATVELIRSMVSRIKIGDPLDPETGMGPMNSRMQLERTLGFISDAKQAGANLITGGGQPKGDIFKRGYWVEPTVFSDVPTSARLWRDEVFGPVLSIVRWTDDEEALRLANDNELGLTAGIVTNDIGKAMRMSKRLRTGYIWINTIGSHYTGVPFGGMKGSGIGREESIEEMFSYTETKSINIQF